HSDPILASALSAYIGTQQTSDSINILRASRIPQAPITDIQILWKKDLPPENYTTLLKSVSGRAADLNKGAGGRYIYIAYTRALKKRHLTSIGVTFFDRQEPLLGYDILKENENGQTADLNFGSNSGLQIYLNTQRSDGPAITNLAVSFPKYKESTPDKFYK